VLVRAARATALEVYRFKSARLDLEIRLAEAKKAAAGK
jgi:hypothetical protein